MQASKPSRKKMRQQKNQPLDVFFSPKTVEEIIRKEAVVRWRDSTDAQNRMRNEMDDFLFELQNKRGITLSLEQMDSLIESCLRIARNRPNDV